MFTIAAFILLIIERMKMSGLLLKSFGDHNPILRGENCVSVVAVMILVSVSRGVRVAFERALDCGLRGFEWAPFGVCLNTLG
jgi:hypothetical protein